MKKYLSQLLEDIKYATENINSPYASEAPVNIWDWISDEEEDQTAPRVSLEEWTGIRKSQLPPAERLTDEDIHLIINPLKAMLDAYNWMLVFQIKVPERLQYQVLQQNFDQEAIQKRWHMGFFEICKKGTPHGQCALGEEYCHCAFFVELFKDMVDEELSPEEERARELEMEIQYLKKKYDDRWMRYYPYHLDKNYDDEHGNPYDYGFGTSEEEEEDEDDWWKT